MGNGARAGWPEAAAGADAAAAELEVGSEVGRTELAATEETVADPRADLESAMGNLRHQQAAAQPARDEGTGLAVRGGTGRVALAVCGVAYLLYVLGSLGGLSVLERGTLSFTLPLLASLLLYLFLRWLPRRAS